MRLRKQLNTIANSQDELNGKCDFTWTWTNGMRTEMRCDCAGAIEPDRAPAIVIQSRRKCYYYRIDNHSYLCNILSHFNVRFHSNANDRHEMTPKI